jgi:hypothetical protein
MHGCPCAEESLYPDPYSVGFIQVASSSSKQYKGAKDGLTPIFSNHCHAPGQQKWPWGEVSVQMQ